MSTMIATTTSDGAQIKPSTASPLREYIDQYHLGNVSVTIKNRRINIAGGDTFNVFGTTEHGDPDHKGPMQTEEFLNGLRSFLDDDAELNIVSLGFTGQQYDGWVATRYCVTTDKVASITLEKPTVEQNEETTDD